jgi:hypothetical protein
MFIIQQIVLDTMNLTEKRQWTPIPTQCLAVNFTERLTSKTIQAISAL